MSSSLEIGSKNTRPAGKYSVLRFHVSEYYSERELENLLEELEARGAHYKEMKALSDPGWFELAVPWDLPFEPYRDTLNECGSIDQVSNFITLSCTIALGTED